MDLLAAEASRERLQELLAAQPPDAPAVLRELATLLRCISEPPAPRSCTRACAWLGPRSLPSNPVVCPRCAAYAYVAAPSPLQGPGQPLVS